MRWPERIVEQVVNRGGGDAEARRRVTIDLDEHREALLCSSLAMSVMCGIVDMRSINLGTQVSKSAALWADEDELVLRTAHGRIDREVLRRLHVELYALDAAGLALDAADDLALPSRYACRVP